MKALIRLFTAALIGLSAVAYGQYVDVRPLTVGILPSTFSVLAASTNTSIASSNIVIEVPKSSVVAIQGIQKLDGAGTTGVVYLFAESVNGSTYTTAKHSLTVTPAGTAETSNVTNVTVGGLMFLKLVEIRNANSANLTNIALWASDKTGL